jgi:exonuclease SbcD
MTKFFHISDVHLGNQQYGLRERFNDFGEAYFAAAECAIKEKVDFVLISGDLFDKTRIDPLTLIQAVEGMKRLQEHGIQVVAIGGNHDHPRYQDSASWLDFLSAQQYLRLLSPVNEQGIQLNPWNGTEGAYVDIEGVRIYGLPYLGASTEAVINAFPELMAQQPSKGIHFTVLMGHFGLEGQIPGAPGGLPAGVLAQLKEKVDYLALGHWHKPYEQDGWIFNPGALECGGIEEKDWKGGYYLISVPEKANEKFSVRHIPSKRRLFHKIVFQVDSYNTPQELLNGLSVRLIAEKSMLGQPEKEPIVELVLEGILPFDRSALNLDAVKQMMEQILEPLLLARPVNNTRSTRFDMDPSEHLPRVEMERQILRELIMSDARFSGKSDDWIAAALEIKELSNMKSTPETIIHSLRKVVEKTGLEA